LNLVNDLEGKEHIHVHAYIRDLAKLTTGCGTCPKNTNAKYSNFSHAVFKCFTTLFYAVDDRNKIVNYLDIRTLSTE